MRTYLLMKFIQICCFEKSHYFSPTVLVLHLAVLGGLLFLSASLWRAFSLNAGGIVALTPRKERRTSWNTVNSWATPLAEVDWSRTWRSTGHCLGWVPTVLHIIDNSFIFCSWQVGFVALHSRWSCALTLDQYTRYSHEDAVGCGWGRIVCSIKRRVCEVCSVLRSAQNSCLLSFTSF